jgi:hypothetical protein
MPIAAKRPTRASMRAMTKVMFFGADNFMLISPFSLYLSFYADQHSKIVTHKRGKSNAILIKH